MPSLPLKTIPKLHYWADLAFIAYQHQNEAAGQSIKQLKNVFRCKIKNEETLATISAVLQMDSFVEHRMYTESYQPGSLHGKALAGTLTGAGVAWMLLRHPDRLGRKVVKQVLIQRYWMSMGSILMAQCCALSQKIAHRD